MQEREPTEASRGPHEGNHRNKHSSETDDEGDETKRGARGNLIKSGTTRERAVYARRRSQRGGRVLNHGQGRAS